MKIVHEDIPCGYKRYVELPFGFSLCWGKTEFVSFYVWLGTKDGGVSIGKDHP
jgi:hypothetical protein